MVGEEVEGTTKANAALLHQSNRRKTKKKPSGRKQPRIKDFDNDTTRKGLVNFKQKTVTKRALSIDSDSDDDDFVHEMPKRKCRRKELSGMSDQSSDENDIAIAL
uniref:Uncharacterized protein n=1 Tax=Amphimedon queenslandica TaxID=400682 RepID=A0A1X7UY89_AMPQE